MPGIWLEIEEIFQSSGVLIGTCSIVLMSPWIHLSGFRLLQTKAILSLSEMQRVGLMTSQERIGSGQSMRGSIFILLKHDNCYYYYNLRVNLFAFTGVSACLTTRSLPAGGV